METFQDIRRRSPAAQVMRITLAREKQRNAYTTRMCRELLVALEQFDRDDAARVLIVTGRAAGSAPAATYRARTPSTTRTCACSSAMRARCATACSAWC